MGYQRRVNSGTMSRLQLSQSRYARTFLSTVFFWSLIHVKVHPIESVKPLYFQLLVSQGRETDLSAYIPAVDLALSLINDNSSILPEYELNYTDIIDPKCSEIPGVHGFIDHVTKQNETEVIVIGADCSVSTQPIASLTPVFNLVQISGVSTSPRLSDVNIYPTFIRVVAPDNSIGIGIAELMNVLNWKYVSIITQEEDIFTLTRDVLIDQLDEHNVAESVGFPTGESPKNALKRVQASHGRVIFLNCYTPYALEIMCQALSLGMTPPDYAWISFGWYFTEFWKDPYANRSSYDAFNHCTPSELERIVDQMILIDQYSRHDEKDLPIIIGNLTKSAYELKYREQWNKTFGNEYHRDHYQDSKFSYDAVWLAALALHRTNEELKALEQHVSLDNFTLDNTDMLSASISSRIYTNALNTSFNGATGFVNLLSNGDREPELRFYQYRPQGNSLMRLYVGFMDDRLQLTVDPLYKGGTPKSHTHENIHAALFAIYTLLSAVGVAFAIVCLVFNMIFRKKMIVKLSSPYLNVVFIIGISMIYLLVVFLGVDDNLVSVGVMSGFCQVTVWIGVIAFTLVYGVVLAKTFKVFYIFKNLQVAKPNQKKAIQDWHMFLLLGLLLAIDVIFLIIVTAVPQAILRAELKETVLTTGELPTEVYQCTSESVHIWAPILLVYKIIEIVFSLIFAFETRKIKVKELNDSRMVIFSVYTIVVAGIAVTPVIVLLGNMVTVKYAIVGIICLISSTLLLGMNFIPKMHYLHKNPSGEIKLNFDTVTDKMMQDKKSSKSRSTSRAEGYSIDVTTTGQERESSFNRNPEDKEKPKASDKDQKLTTIEESKSQ